MTERLGRQRPPATIPASTWWWIRAAAILVTIFVAVQLLGVVQSVLSALLTVVRLDLPPDGAKTDIDTVA